MKNQNEVNKEVKAALPTNISHTISLNTPYNSMFISYTFQNQPEEVEVVLENSKGLGLHLWHCMLNDSHRDVYYTMEKVEEDLKAGKVKEIVIEKFLATEIERGAINHSPQPPTIDLNTIPYEEELVDGLDREEANWYYWSEAVYVEALEGREESLTDMERANL
jgi:hypothetical protein